MTLEEVIGFFDRDKGVEFLPYEVKEIYDCLVNLKELEIYKKALELACEDIYRFVGNEFGENYKNPCDYADGYLQKAREE